MNDDLQMIPIDHIRIINPRLRNKSKFELIVDSIKKLGLKKPIQVSRRAADEGGGYPKGAGGVDREYRLFVLPRVYRTGGDRLPDRRAGSLLYDE